MAKIQCNNCHQYKVKRLSSLVITAGIALICVGVVLSVIVIGIFGVIAGVIALIGGIAMRVTGIGDKYICNNCKKQFKVSEAKQMAA